MPLTRYVKSWVAHAPGMPGTFPPPLWLNNPDMHHSTCVTHVPCCMLGSLNSGFISVAGGWWLGKRSRLSRCMCNPQFHVSGKRPMGVTRATVNCILRRHSATGTLVLGKSMGAPQKTAPRRDSAVFSMVWEDRLISAQALMAQLRHLYRMRADQKTINNWLLSRGKRAYRPKMKPLLTDNQHRLCLERGQRWQNLTMAHWQHVIFGDESRFQLYLVDGRLRVQHSPSERVQQRYKAYRVQAGGGLEHVWGALYSGVKSPLPPRQIPHRWALQRHFAIHLSVICPAAFRGLLPPPRR